jgi:Sortase domain
MVVRAFRCSAYVALLVGVALAGDGVSSMIPLASSSGPVYASAITAPFVSARPTRHLPVPLVPVHFAPPVRLLIPSLNLNARVELLGLDSSGAMQTPRNIWNVGWYRGGPSPGAPGDAVIDGHVGLPGSPLVFSGLGRLAVGADVIVVLADGTRSRFRVSGVRSWPATSHPTGLFSRDGRPRLSLITCTGRYDGGSQTYANRLIVDSSFVGPA